MAEKVNELEDANRRMRETEEETEERPRRKKPFNVLSQRVTGARPRPMGR